MSDTCSLSPPPLSLPPPQLSRDPDTAESSPRRSSDLVPDSPSRRDSFSPLTLAPALVVTTVDPPFTIEHVNTSWVRLCGYTPAEAVGGTLKLLQGPLTSDVELQKLHATLSNLGRASVRLTNYTKSGEPFLHTLLVEPVSDQYDSNALTHFVGRLIPAADEETEAQLDSVQPSPSWWPHAPHTFSASTPPPSPKSSDEADARLLLLFATQLALVKTVKNDDWLALVNRLALGEAFRTSLSLPPAHGAGMALFGRVSSGVAGLVWHRKALDLNSAFMWPPGYFAKTEHNMIADAKGNIVLVGGREEARVSLEALLDINAQHARSSADAPPLSYNELSLLIEGSRGIVGVFVRSTREDRLLFALGVRSLLEHCLPSLHPLPLLLLTTNGGAAPLPRAEQLRLLSSVASKDARVREERDGWLEARLPIDTMAFAELSPLQQLQLHARYGITSRSLVILFRKLSCNGHDVAALRACLSYALALAIEHNNPPSAREVVRAGSPLMLAAWKPLVEAVHPDKDGSIVTFTMPTPPRRYAELGELSGPVEADADGETGALGNAEAAEGALEGSRAAGSSEALACPPVKTIIPSQDLLVALGAKITLNEFVAGRTTARLSNACQQLAHWLLQAQRPRCSSLLFLLRSWQETKQVEPGSDLLTFLGGKAVENRKRFHEALSQLHEASDGLSYVTLLYSLVRDLRRPCLRLRVLQQVLGLDCRFSRDIVFGVVCLACDVVEGLGSTEASVHGRLGETDRAGCVERVSFSNYDEAAELEADIALGPRRRSGRPTDPLGHERRQYRVTSGARH